MAARLPQFTKTYTGGYRSYRFEHGGQTYEVFRFKSKVLGWCVDRIDGHQHARIVVAEDTRRAAVSQITQEGRH
ncbi:hypothetical protein [Streptomyces sp. NPDC051994]|uniref:hypothetical protein n=1 Tax=unclassified Streptomyces TaxID=2593676 RepID=UPI00341BC322